MENQKKELISLMAEWEVLQAGLDSSDLLKAKFSSSLFNDIPPKQKDLPSAINLYEQLTLEQLERRYCIHFWENCAFLAFYSLAYGSQANFNRSIDKREFLRTKIQNIDLLLNKGINNLLQDKEYLYVSSIPEMYQQLRDGKPPEFFSAKELENYEKESQEINDYLLEYMANNEKDQDCSLLPSEILINIPECFANAAPWLSSESNSGEKYVNYFNPDWITAMQIQSLIWYKEFLGEILSSNELYYNLPWNVYEREPIRSKKTVGLRNRERSNTDIEAMHVSFNDFVAEYERAPNVDELMEFMEKNPPHGFDVKFERRGLKRKIENILIDGKQKTVDAFKIQFKRNFVKDKIETGKKNN